jgi:hypothetical protein
MPRPILQQGRATDPALPEVERAAVLHLVKGQLRRSGVARARRNMKMKEMHIVHLSTQVSTLLRDLHKVTGPNGLIFGNCKRRDITKQYSDKASHDRAG